MDVIIYEIGDHLFKGAMEMSRQRHQMEMLKKGGLIGAGLIALTGVVYFACNKYENNRKKTQDRKLVS